MKNIIRTLALFALLAFPAALHAQGVGQIAAGQVWGNPTPAKAPASPASLSAMLDRGISSTRGSIITRGAAAWAALGPGTAGLPLLSAGAGADLAYGVLGLSGGGSAANLTASNGGIVYSTASAMAILSGTATAGQIVRSGASAAPTWSTATYPATAAAGTILNAGSANVLSATAAPTLGVAGSLLGTLALAGSGSGSVLITPQTTAGSPTLTLPNASGTFAVSAVSPLALSATTGALSISGAAGQVPNGTTGAFTATPTLGANGGTGGQITLNGATSGSGIIRVNAAAGSGIVFQLPSTNGSNTNVLQTDGAGVLSWSAAGSGTVTSVTCNGGLTGGAITTTGTCAADIATGSNFLAGTANKIVDAAVPYQAETTSTFNATQVLDFNTFQNTKITLTANITSFSCSNQKAGQGGKIRFIQDATGSRTIPATFGCNMKFAGGVQPVLTTTANAIDELVYHCHSSSYCLASMVLNTSWLFLPGVFAPRGWPANDNMPFRMVG